MKDYPEFRARSRGEVDDVLSAAPSHWLDEENATNADHFYRCVILRGPMTLSSDIAGIESHLQRLLAKYQPEGRYAATSEDDRAEIVRQLRERADARDLKSVDAIEKANSRSSSSP